jgi:hypothetical protein
MFKYVLAFVILVAAMAHFVSSGVDAQTPGPPPLASPFNPSFGDLMNTLVQPRHAKLGLIGREQNWALAAYEIHQLKAALMNIAVWRPRFGNHSVPELMEAMASEPIQALEAAVQARDSGQFAKAYDRLTEGCNGCHTALGHGYVVIQVPDQSYFANQVFRAVR